MCASLHIGCVIFVRVFLCWGRYVNKWCIKDMCFLPVLCVHNCNSTFHVSMCHYT